MFGGEVLIAGRTVGRLIAPLQARYSGLPLGVGRLGVPNGKLLPGNVRQAVERELLVAGQCPAEMGGMFDALARLGRQRAVEFDQYRAFFESRPADECVPRGYGAGKRGRQQVAQLLRCRLPPAQLVLPGYQEKAVPVPPACRAALLQRVSGGRPSSGPSRDLLVGGAAPHVLDACREFQVPREIAGQPPQQRGRGCQTDRTQGPASSGARRAARLRPLPGLTASATPGRSGNSTCSVNRVSLRCPTSSLR